MIWYYILAFFAHGIESFAGFGSTAMALPFLSIAIGTSKAVSLLALNSIASGGTIFFLNLRRVNWREYAKITLLVLPFLPIGLAAFAALSQYEPILKLLLGVATCAAGARGAWYHFVKRQEPPALGKASQYIALILGALVQGMFNAGGPLIAIYANEQLKDKGAFRATMSALWFSVNIIGLAIRLIWMDVYSTEIFIEFLWCIPVMAAGILIGSFLHKKADNTLFRKVVYLILLAGGLASTIYCAVSLFA